MIIAAIAVGYVFTMVAMVGFTAEAGWEPESGVAASVFWPLAIPFYIGVGIARMCGGE